MLALKTQEPKKLSRNEQLRTVSEEADAIWKLHREGQIDSEEAARRLAELRVRYSSFFDRFLAL